MEIFNEVLTRLDSNPNPIAGAIARDIRKALANPAKGTMKAWITANNGKRVHTVQIDTDLGSVWIPLSRVIDASRSTSVEFNGSARYYRGMRVLHTSDRAIVVADEFHTIAYTLAD